ncbi:MAG: RDD family protein [Halanaerobiales bacterium]
MQNHYSSSNIYAGFAPRLAAFLIDSLILIVVLLPVRATFFIFSLISPSNLMTKPVLFQFSVIDIVLYLLTAIYYVSMTYYYGTTLGKKLFNLKVVSTDGSELTFINVLYRETIGKYLSSIIFIGYLMIAIDSEKRGLHDRLCDTRVVYNINLPDNVATNAVTE